MSGDLDPGVRHRLEESNIEPSAWPKWSPIIEAVCQHSGGIRPMDLDAWSVGDLYQLPTYPPHRTEEFVIGVLQGTALVFGREKGSFKKKLDFKAIELDKVGAAQFWPDDQDFGNNWGSCDVQAVSSGGQPVFRLGWTWGSRTPMAKAARERDRILQFLTNPPQAQRSVEEYRQASREAATAYLAMDNGRFLPVAASLADAERLLAEARERGDDMVSFPAVHGGGNVQLVRTITQIVPPEAVAHLDHPELGR